MERKLFKFAHVNIVARDWRKLSAFYEQVFGCERVPPERDLEGEAIDHLTGLPQARIRGIHLRLPGCGADGPTLEIFQYNISEARPGTAIHRPGFAHIAFKVDDVDEIRSAVLSAGGGAIGKTVALEIKDGGHLTAVYLTDPEGNIIECQRWED
ncbi:MAG: VOC family protein [Candidatus Eisenbacteria bacterium]|uniref:VOC family protein n=1 Tax=Eiseniibacteriota bacterium TaxID=2212470 RepID=A0A948RUY7_UNCEI|nr:VOC family protein [Candidatus Eisenbacteria bacterium]MBU1949189.1 VOC family protein [Candidatus Eisenbacteria bacterium]MBU2691488.1 VOC family protein [Candidatus Eisenbacteria bacterium]